MRIGGTVAGAVSLQELRANQKKRLSDGGDDLLNTPPEEVETLNMDVSGTNRALFVFGLHSPFDTRVARHFPGT